MSESVLYTAIAVEDQSIWDMSIQEYGSIDQIFNVLEDNGLNMDSYLIPGDKVLIRENFDGNIPMMQFFRGKRKVVTGNGKKSGGIGYMRIGSNFKVS